MKNLSFHLTSLLVTLGSLAHYLSGNNPYGLLFVACAFWTIWLGVVIAANSVMDLQREPLGKAVLRLLHLPLGLLIVAIGAAMGGAAASTEVFSMLTTVPWPMKALVFLLFTAGSGYALYALHTRLGNYRVQAGTVVVRNGTLLREGDTYRHLVLAGDRSKLEVFPATITVKGERIWVELPRQWDLRPFNIEVRLRFVEFATKKAARRGMNLVVKQANEWLRDHARILIEKYGGAGRNPKSFANPNSMVTIGGARFLVEHLESEERTA